MTAAFNLAQLANNLNTSGQLDATDGLTGLVANANLASSGTASSSTYLRGDRTWQTLTQTVLRVESYSWATRTSLADPAGTFTTILSGTYTKQSASSTVIAMICLSAYGEYNGSGVTRLNLGSSTVYGTYEYSSYPGPKQITPMFIVSGNTQTGSLSWTWQHNYQPFRFIINPNSTDNAQIVNQSVSYAIIMEVV